MMRDFDSDIDIDGNRLVPGVMKDDDNFNTACSVVFVDIADPDNCLALPIYVGTAERAYMKLPIGEYRGTDDNADDEVAIILVVEAGFSWVRYDIDYYHMLAINEEFVRTTKP